jgi:hypothetical protein
MSGGGGGGLPPMAYYVKKDGQVVIGDPGLPPEAIEQGITTTTGYQVWAQQQLSNKQLAQQSQIANQQDTFNRDQLAAQQQQQEKQQAQVDEQAGRQSTYDAGRAQALSAGAQQVNDAFAKFTPDYFKQYQSDYMKQATDDINYQKGIASKQLLFGLARQGISDSQTSANQQGLLEENAGMATAKQTANALTASNQLEGQVSNAKANLLGQVQSSQGIGSPIAGGNDASVQGALQTQRNAISGITNSAGDVTASLQGVPTVSPLSNIFGNLIGAAGSYLGGVQQNSALGAYAANAGLAGKSPGSGSTSVR